MKNESLTSGRKWRKNKKDARLFADLIDIYERCLAERFSLDLLKEMTEFPGGIQLDDGGMKFSMAACSAGMDYAVEGLESFSERIDVADLRSYLSRRGKYIYFGEQYDEPFDKGDF